MIFFQGAFFVCLLHTTSTLSLFIPFVPSTRRTSSPSFTRQPSCTAPFGSPCSPTPSQTPARSRPILNSSSNGGIKQRLTLNAPPARDGKHAQKLILISGCPGTGKSTFGMSLALDQGILKCISTDTVRAVMRSYVPEGISPPLHRSSYASVGDEDNPVKSWAETCKVLESSVEGLVDDAIERKVSLVLEGVSISPSRRWIDKWEEAGGTACGVLLMVSEEEVHKNLLLKRGFTTGNEGAEQKKLASFDRVRLIQDEMVLRAKESGWVLIEQRLGLDPLDVVADELFRSATCGKKKSATESLKDVSDYESHVKFVNELIRADSNQVDGVEGDAKGRVDI